MQRGETPTLHTLFTEKFIINLRFTSSWIKIFQHG